MSPKQLAVRDPIVWKNISAGQPNFSKQHTKTAVFDNEPDIQVLLHSRPPFIVGANHVLFMGSMYSQAYENQVIGIPT